LDLQQAAMSADEIKNKTVIFKITVLLFTITSFFWW